MSCQALCHQPLHTHVHQDPKNNWRLPFKIQSFARFSLVSLSIHPLSRRGAERIRQGEGRWSRPPKTALERSDLTEKIQFRASHTEAKTRKTLDRIKKRRMIMHIYKIILWCQGFGQEFFFVSAEVCDSRNWNFRSNSFFRAPPSGGGSNAPRPAVSVPHIDVNADGCRARQTISCKNTACRGRISEISDVSLCLQGLDNLQNWYHFQTVLDNV